MYLDGDDPRIAAAVAWLDQQVAAGLTLQAGLPGPVVTFGEDCNPDYLLGSLPTGMAVTLCAHHSAEAGDLAYEAQP